MTTTFNRAARRPAPTDGDGALDFSALPTPGQPAKPKPPARSTSIQLSYHGALVTFTYAADVDLSVAELEAKIDAMLKREGWST